jgi:hypothetical protein
MNHNDIKVNVNMLISLLDSKGNLKDSCFLHNVMTTAGKNAIADQILATPTLAKIGWCELGTSATVAFTVTSANATVGATFTNNGVTFTVLATIAGGTTLYCSTSGYSTAAASGTLTKASGTGDSTITFSAWAYGGWTGQSLLNAYISESRTAFDSKTRNNNVITIVTTYAAGVGTGSVTEAALFDVVTQNTANMWAYGSFIVKNKEASDTMQITWTITIN